MNIAGRTISMQPPRLRIVEPMSQADPICPAPGVTRFRRGGIHVGKTIVTTMANHPKLWITMDNYGKTMVNPNDPPSRLYNPLV